jgi:hypothetical protein
MKTWMFGILAILLVGCGSSDTEQPQGQSGSGGTGSGNPLDLPGQNSDGGTGIGMDGGQILDDPNSPETCGDVGKSIYVVSTEDMLLKFDPPTLKFSTIGKLKCATDGSHPFSMAVDRQGTAWVLYDTGKLYHVSTTDGSCKNSGYQPGQKGWTLFGMGFVSDTVGSSAETLFVIDGTGVNGGTNAGKGLGKIDTSTLKIAPVAQFNGGLAGRTAEVTGLGNGKLFGFFVDVSDTSATSVAEIDRNSAKVLSNTSQALPTINAWAFAHWGGSFYLFNGTGSKASRVHKYNPIAKTTTEVVANAGYRIVGAGVSTCAPLIEPVK